VSAIRDPLADHLITPQNSAIVVIDYQPQQIAAVRSMDPDLVLKNIGSTMKLANTFGLPIVHSKVNVASGRGKPTVPELAELLEGSPPIAELPSTHGKTPISSPPCVPLGGASSSCVRSGPRSAWRSRRLTP
jgi:nicotinamidase-related amidase